MPKVPLHSKLAHLSESQINNLITRYYAGETIADLLNEFRIDCHPSHLYKLFPPIIHSSAICPHCGTTMMSRRVPRSSYIGAPAEQMFCSNCRHRGSRRCKCDACRNHQTKLIDQSSQKYSTIDTVVNNRLAVEALRPADLTIEQAVSLLSLNRCLAFTDLGNKKALAALDKASVPFAPIGAYGGVLLETLKKTNILNVLSSPSIDGFSVLNGNAHAELPCLIAWNVPSSIRDNLILEIEQCAFKNLWPDLWFDQVADLVRALAYAECKEFYDYCAKQRGLPASGPRGTAVMLNNLLQDYSVSQCYRIIYSGAQSAADFLVRTSCASQHAANYMIGACQRWIERAKAENWTVSPFHRDYQLPRSMVSYVLYDLFLKIGEDGFNVPIANIVVKKK